MSLWICLIARCFGYGRMVAILISLARNAVDMIKYYDRTAQRAEQLPQIEEGSIRESGGQLLISVV